MKEPEISQPEQTRLSKYREVKPSMPLGRIAVVSLVTAALVSLACGDDRSRNKITALDNVNEIVADPRDDSRPNVAETEGDDKATCRTDVDCRVAGPWRTCLEGRCEVMTSGRTLKIASIDVNRPLMVRGALNETLASVIDAGDLNLLIHLDDPLSWVIQGQPSGSLDGLTTYGQSEAFGSYCGPSAVDCLDDICTATFRPQSTTHRMILRIRNHHVEDEDSPCAYQTLEVTHVEIHVVINLRPIPGITGQTQPSSVVTLTGVLPNHSVESFIMENGRSLMENMDLGPDSERDIASEDGTLSGWPIEFSALGHPVLFDNDPTAVFNSQPTETRPPTPDAPEDCQ